jgi:chromosome segregation ATPase
MGSVREQLRARLDRLRERKARLVAEVTAIQAQIDDQKATLDALTPSDEQTLARLQGIGIIEAKD